MMKQFTQTFPIPQARWARFWLRQSPVIGIKPLMPYLTLFEGFSVSVGTSTVGLTVDNLSAAYASIMANRGMGQDVYAVLDPRQIWGSYGLFNDVVTSTQFGGSPALQSSALENAYFDKISTNAVKGGVFTRNALGMGVSGPPAGFKVEHTRQGTYTRDCFTASTFFGVLELVDLWGVEVHTKVS